MKRVTKHMQLPSGRQSGLFMTIDNDWSTEQAAAVAELLEDLLHVIYSRYQDKLHAHQKATRITRFKPVYSDDDDGVPF
ncbi:MAG: hypothetical protein IPH35_10645 [Rhodoferax sp.]|nr:hypothetical protein [Rhodoferax sp.]